MSESISIQTCPDTKLRYIVVGESKYVLKDDLQLSFDGAPHNVSNFLNRVGGYDESPEVHDQDDLESPFRFRPQYDTRPREGFRSSWSFDAEPKVEADPERVSKIQAADDMSDEELKALCGDDIPDMTPAEPEPVADGRTFETHPDDRIEGEDGAEDTDEYEEWDEEDEDAEDVGDVGEVEVLQDTEPYDADLSENEEDLEIVE